MRSSTRHGERGAVLTVLAAILVAGSTALLASCFVDSLVETIERANPVRYIELSMFYVPVALLIFGNFIYLIARFGYFRRVMAHRAATRRDIEAIYGRDPPGLVILVPSYKEEDEVIRQTLISAALVEYPGRRIVLLIDDPPIAANPPDEARLQAARRLPQELGELFAPPAEEFRSALREYQARVRLRGVDAAAESREIARLYDRAADWLDAWAAAYRRGRPDVVNHIDALFVEKILGLPATAHRERARELARVTLAPDEVAREYARIGSLFSPEFSSFERKRYANLSRASNKAMNLNSYLALIGGSFREVVAGDGLHLERCAAADADLHVPDAGYIVTLDADSLIVSDYALRLVHVLAQPGNENIALAQTPYLAIPGSPNLLERTAGATTDLHYVVQQGVSHFNAAFWVGPNALVRRSALEDIVTCVEERGHAVKVFIQDRTVIEDTGATVDLIRNGWRLYNYLAPMAYSATPPDFGALVIQRQRWANGGLLILPCLARWLLRGPMSPAKLHEAMLRMYSLVSACLIGTSMLMLIFYSFDDSLVTRWLPLAAIPYYVLLSRDLAHAGYRLADLPRIYALQMVLVPVLAGGTLRSLQQAITGRKAAFSRTPKVAGRTQTSSAYLVVIYFIFFYSLVSAISNAAIGRHYHAALSLAVFGSYLYAIARFIGVRASVEDLVSDLRSRQWWTVNEAGFALQSRNLALAPIVTKADRGTMAETGAGGG
jgi:cellulose synthase (UDP-forming)